MIFLSLKICRAWTDLLIASGKFEEAVARTETLIRLDPLNMFESSGRAMSLYFNNQPQNALEAVDLVRQSAIADNHVGIGRVCLYLGKYERTIEILEPLQKDIPVPRVLGTLAIAYYHIGERDESDDLLQKIITISKETSAGSPSLYIAMIYSQMGEVETAFEWLDKAYEDHEVEMYWLKVEPPFEPLHDDPRWQEMLDKVGFPD